MQIYDASDNGFRDYLIGVSNHLLTKKQLDKIITNLVDYEPFRLNSCIFSREKFYELITLDINQTGSIIFGNELKFGNSKESPYFDENRKYAVVVYDSILDINIVYIYIPKGILDKRNKK